MAKVRETSSSDSPKPRRPALSPESREKQMIAYAIDLAEKQLIDGTASSQVITHFLKLGTTRAELEKEKLEKENELLIAKTKALESQEKSDELYRAAIKAFASYSGHGEPDDY